MRRAHRALLAIVLGNISLQHTLTMHDPVDPINLAASAMVLIALLLFVYLD